MVQRPARTRPAPVTSGPRSRWRPAQQAGRPQVAGPKADPDNPPAPLRGHQIVELTIAAGSPAAGHELGSVTWPPGWIPVTVLGRHGLRDADPSVILIPGDRVNLLATGTPNPPEPAREPPEPLPAPG